MIGNPTNPSGRFAKAFKSPGISKISISAFDTPNFTEFEITEQDIIRKTWEDKLTSGLPAPYLVTPRWVADRLADWGESSPLYLSRIKAQFPAQSDDTLIPLHLIEAAVERNLTPGDPCELGVDVARFGADETVILHRAGPVVRIIKTLPTCDTMELTGHVVQSIREMNASAAKIDGVGVGAGVLDRLVELNLPAFDMQSGAGANEPEKYKNARAEWWWGLRTRFEEGDIDIENDEILVSQLANIKYKVTSRGQILIESKEDMKKRGLPSPDRADTLMLVFAEPKTVPAKRIYQLEDTYAV
jgi:hypothetical protein